MSNIHKNFYRNFYLSTSGYLPCKPLSQNMFPGDFFQIRNGEMIVLGNIFRNGIINPTDVEFGKAIKLSPTGWTFSEGVAKPYSGRGTGAGPITGDFEYSKQIFAFALAGSCFFKGRQPESVRIVNWNDIQQELIIKLTQTLYSFRDVYVVTDSATTSDWTLAIAGSDAAEMELATDAENIGLVDIFGDSSAKTVQTKDIEYYHRQDQRQPNFFKAKKLAVQEDRLEFFISEMISKQESHAEWAQDFYGYNFDAGTSIGSGKNNAGSILDMLHANQLNPNTALLYFRWVDTNLDDIEKLFM